MIFSTDDEKEAYYKAIQDFKALQGARRRLLSALLQRQMLGICEANRVKAARNDPRWKIPNWAAAYARLIELLPNAREIVLSPTYLRPSAVLAATEAAGLSWEVRSQL